MGFIHREPSDRTRDREESLSAKLFGVTVRKIRNVSNNVDQVVIVRINGRVSTGVRSVSNVCAQSESTTVKQATVAVNTASMTSRETKRFMGAPKC